MRDPHEPQERLSRYRTRAEDEAWLVKLNDGLSVVELPALAGGDHAQLPLIYVVGAPRSGTTLVSQVLSRYLEVGYINNLIARFWRRPSVGILISRLVLGADARDGITFESEHGSTRSVYGPHEFGYFWREWLRLDEQPTHHLSESALEDVDQAGLRRALEGEILGAFGLPVVFKNVICGFQASALARIHQHSLFVHVVRDKEATCRSILVSRHQRYGNYEAWWSLKPSSYAEIAALADPSEQVVRQVDDCRSELGAELSRPGVRAVTLSYESFCREPMRLLQDIVEAAEPMGSRIQILHGVPESFVQSTGPPLPPDLQTRLRDALHRQPAKG